MLKGGRKGGGGPLMMVIGIVEVKFERNRESRVVGWIIGKEQGGDEA